MSRAAKLIALAKNAELVKDFEDVLDDSFEDPDFSDVSETDTSECRSTSGMESIFGSLSPEKECKQEGLLESVMKYLQKLDDDEVISNFVQSQCWINTLTPDKETVADNLNLVPDNPLDGGCLGFDCADVSEAHRRCRRHQQMSRPPARPRRQCRRRREERTAIQCEWESGCSEGDVAGYPDFFFWKL
ncbi:unnamed protein product [Bemisia tabaci]|uniref:Uncharacterized protein n=1 Tax=Bemisia tabaci TaxID=7038 RepID=A0A9P0A9L5_BEMTA|nr:unnamed protein product [Bemisia tabaci]